MAKWEESPIIQPLVPPSAVREQPTDSQPATPGFEGNVVVPGAATVEGGGALGRIGSAAVRGYQETPPILTPQARAANDQAGPVGRFLTNPLLDITGAGIGAVAGLGAGLGQVAYETGNAIGGPQLGRDFYMGNQVAPVAAIDAPRVTMPNANRLMLKEQPPAVSSATPEMNLVPGMQRVAPEVVDRAAARPLAESSPVPAATQLSSSPPVAAPPVTTAAQAKQIASSYYKIADDAGGALAPPFVNKFIDGVEAVIPQTEAGKAVAGQSPASALVERLQTLREKPMTLQAAQEVDEALGALIDKEYGVKGLSKEGQKLVGIQRDFRDHIESAGPGDITGGTAGFDALGPARKAWSQAMKLDDLERIQQRASMTDNPATSIKTQIRTLLTNRTKSRGYDDAEIAALEAAAQRGALGSALHVFGSRLIPLGAGAAEVGTHGLTAGLITAAATHLGTAKLRDWGTALQQNRLNNAMGVLGQGVPRNPLLAPPP